MRLVSTHECRWLDGNELEEIRACILEHWIDRLGLWSRWLVDWAPDIIRGRVTSPLAGEGLIERLRELSSFPNPYPLLWILRAANDATKSEGRDDATWGRMAARVLERTQTTLEPGYTYYFWRALHAMRTAIAGANRIWLLTASGMGWQRALGPVKPAPFDDSIWQSDLWTHLIGGEENRLVLICPDSDAFTQHSSRIWAPDRRQFHERLDAVDPEERRQKAKAFVEDLISDGQCRVWRTDRLIGRALLIVDPPEEALDDRSLDEVKAALTDTHAYVESHPLAGLIRWQPSEGQQSAPDSRDRRSGSVMPYDSVIVMANKTGFDEDGVAMQSDLPRPVHRVTRFDRPTTEHYVKEFEVWCRTACSCRPTT